MAIPWKLFLITELDWSILVPIIEGETKANSASIMSQVQNQNLILCSRTISLFNFKFGDRVYAASLSWNPLCRPPLPLLPKRGISGVCHHGRTVTE